METEIKAKERMQSKEATVSSVRGRTQVLRGRVVSDKMNKTRIMEIRRSKRHMLYHKSLARRTKIFVHDDKNESKTGDTILAISSRPISKNKDFRLLKIISKQVEQ